jgi:hypothetical protein
MPDLIFGVALAFGASSLYSLGVVIQAMDAKLAPADEFLRLALAWRLIRRSRWLLGTGISILGWPLQLLALLLAPLVVVQPALAGGLLVLFFLGERLLNEHAGRRERLAIAAILLGVLGTALTAPPRVTATPGGALFTLALVLLACATLLPYALRLFDVRYAPLAIMSAGLGFAWSGLGTKLASDNLSHSHLLAAGLWALATAAISAVAALSEMSALQSRPAIQVAPVVFVTQTVIPVVLAPLLLGERFSSTPLHGVPLAVSLAVLVLGAATLTRSPILLGLIEADSADGPRPEASGPSGSTARPSAESHATNRRIPASDDEEPSAETTSTSPSRSLR